MRKKFLNIEKRNQFLLGLELPGFYWFHFSALNGFWEFKNSLVNSLVVYRNIFQNQQGLSNTKLTKTASFRAPYRARTGDLLIKSQMLCQLS